MFFYVTIGILFCYTLLLIGFFMGWCTLIPAKFHSRKGLPFSTIKSPRRNTKFVAIDTVSSSASLEQIRHISDRERLYSLAKKKKCSLPLVDSRKLDDYLHPKYSLPPRTSDILQRKLDFESFLRVPGRTSRSESIPSAKSIENFRRVSVPEVKIIIEEF
ncbi:unnamed protein product, partial [Mesorhabditis belari]|uniref:Uncharacterized protein n=1 Tax=Mesorhabditis belari TaxID=2138241 RepID=A0AAF3FDT8_9BILA